MAKEVAKIAPSKSAAKNDKKKKSFGSRFTRFFKDLKSEIKKVIWPSKTQIKNNTIVVLIFMAIAAVFTWGIDFILTTITNLIFK